MALRKAQSAALLTEESKYVRPSYRQKGSEMRGSLYKGATANAFTKKTIGSIPSKFETVLYPQNSAMRKGFGSNCYRFSGAVTENPGPGAYIDPARTSTDSFRMASDSYSRKGYGNGFIGSRERFKIENYQPYQIPGPGAYKYWETNYSPPQKVAGTAFGVGSLSEKYKNKEMAVFSREIAQKRAPRPSPALRVGPGAYNIPRTLVNAQDYKNTASFKAKANRFYTAKAGQFPGPGQYERDMEGIKRELLRTSLGTVGELATTANFKQPTGYKRVKVNLYDPFENVEGEEKRTPGPGHYAETNFTIQQKAIEKPAGSSMFAQHEIVDRFGLPKQEAVKALERVSPGPGQYHSTDDSAARDDDEARKLKPSAPFRSQVQRNAYGRFPHVPGPAFYKVKSEVLRDTKNINPAREWI
jgi:hypothetical protein